MVKQGGTGTLLHIKKIRLNFKIFKRIVHLYKPWISKSHVEQK